MKACCVTGHRDIAADKMDYVREKLNDEIEAAIRDGFTIFISGFAAGADMIFAKLIVEKQEQNPKIHLEAAFPYPTWFKNRSEEDNEILSKCHAFGTHSPRYSPNCFLIRNRFMVNTCERVIAVYDGRESGGTVNTMRYASALERELRVIEL